MPTLTTERVHEAHAAVRSGDRSRALEYWHPEVRFLAPGNHPYSGWHDGLDAFMAFLKTFHVDASGNTLKMEPFTTLINEEEGWSVDVNRCYAQRVRRSADDADSPYNTLEIQGLHLLKWRDGRIAEGRAAIFGDGTTNFNLWWSPVDPSGARTVI